jgi:hypothetical protein
VFFAGGGGSEAKVSLNIKYPVNTCIIVNHKRKLVDDSKSFTTRWDET